MEKKEINYIRQLLLELEDYLFSLSWYDGEDRLKTFRDVSNIKSIFQLVPKRYLKLLEGKIYTQYELDKAREETRQEERDMFIVGYAIVSFNEVIKTIKTLSIIEFLSIKWGLKGKKKSKLTTK